jgi:HlyD family secretion protein
VLENGRPRPVNVKIGSTDGELTEITSGLEEGAQVITAQQRS